jgi:hypothetical protein
MNLNPNLLVEKLFLLSLQDPGKSLAENLTR